MVPDATAFEPVETWPGLTDMSRLQKLLWAAKRPIALVGGSRWSEQACAALMRFAERFALPVATTFRRGYLFDALHPCYAGDMGIGPNPKLLARVKGADLVLLIGGRMSEMPSQSYTLFDIPEPQMKLVHVHPGAEELGRVYHPALAINAAPTAFCSALEGLQPPNEIAWQGEATTAHADYLAWSEKATPQPGGVNLGEIMVWLRENLPPDAIITNGAGNFAGWIHRFYRFRKFAHPGRPDLRLDGLRLSGGGGDADALIPSAPVVCVAGDGDFLMTGQDFATAVQYELPVIVVLADNGLYGTIRMHQEREYPGRVIATALHNPGFRRLRLRLRRLRRAGGEDRRFPRRLRRRAGVRQAVDHPSEDRSGSDHAGRRLPASARSRWPAPAARAGRIGADVSKRSGDRKRCLPTALNHRSLVPCPIAAPRTSSAAWPSARRRSWPRRPRIAAEGGMAAVQIAAVAGARRHRRRHGLPLFPVQDRSRRRTGGRGRRPRARRHAAAADAAPGPLSALAGGIATFAAARARRAAAGLGGDRRAGRCAGRRDAARFPPVARRRTGSAHQDRDRRRPSARSGRRRRRAGHRRRTDGRAARAAGAGARPMAPPRARRCRARRCWRCARSAWSMPAPAAWWRNACCHRRSVRCNPRPALRRAAASPA